MYHFKAWWTSFYHSFHDSETLLLARIKLFLGVGFTALQQSGIDVAGFVENPKLQMALKVVFAWLIVDGTISEWARRSRATDLGDPEVPIVPPIPPIPTPGKS